MSYQVFARKWRPQAFDAVVGQDAITRTLRNALATDRVAHAYLFAGPRGIGKTTTARLLARALLCTARTGADACRACEACREVEAGASVDLIEIDGASNRKIEDMRVLRENVKYAPARGRHKVYIIDEAHQLTAEAFNALLKTLEEPPPHVVFVLATTDPRDMPATILSRVQRFDFRPIAHDVLAAALEQILVAEAIPFEPAALPLLARAAEGSLRDALSLLDTAVAYGEGRLAAAPVAELLGATAPAEVRAFARALVAHDAAGALDAIARAAREGEDLGAFGRDTIELLRRALVLAAAPDSRPADLAPGEVDELRALLAGASLDEALYLLRALLDADAAMRQSPHPRVELEIAAVRAARRPAPERLEALLARVDELRASLGGAAGAAPAHLSAATAPAQALLSDAPTPLAAEAQADETPHAPPNVQGTVRRRASSAGAEPVAAPSRLPAAGGQAGRASTGVSAADDPSEPSVAADLAGAWAAVVDEVMRRKPTVGAVLARARPLGVADGELTIAVGGNHFERDLLADPANRELVVAAARRHVPGVERVAVTSEGAVAGDVRTHPAVRAALDEFDGEIVAVRPRPAEGGAQ